MCAASYDIIMMQMPEHWPNKHRTNLRPYRIKRKEVCSKTNIWVRDTSRRYNQQCENMKWAWVEHTNRLKDDRWASRVRHDKKIPQGRPARRWRDDLDKYRSDTIWQTTAQDRITWRRHADAFAKPRDATAAQ